MNDINDVVKQVKLATDFQINKRLLREKILTELHMPYNSGLFKLTPELLAFVTTWPDEILYLEDVYQNPIEINRIEFLEKARQKYHAAMNDWHQQYAELRKIRKV